MDNSTFFNYLGIMPNIDFNWTNEQDLDIKEIHLRPFHAKFVRIIFTPESLMNFGFAFDLRLS